MKFRVPLQNPRNLPCPDFIIETRFRFPTINYNEKNKDFSSPTTDFNLGCQKKVAMLDDYLYGF